uniref:Similar to SAC domain protein 7 n=1 Tax=Oryza sativa subsp. japonica TaxID=39947 RepID=Q53M65_ORYSJ|nr:Similar to SAC domain protein 7 [Oryza sativa Japonica Group]
MSVATEACPSPKLHTRLRLWEFADRYVFEPVDGLADLFLSVDRTNGSMSLVEELPPRGPSTNPKVRIVFGVIGVLKLAVRSYFLVITGRDCVGSYLGHAIFKLTGLKVLPCNNSLNTSSAEQLVKHLSLPLICCSSQRLHDLGDQFKSLPLWRQNIANTVPIGNDSTSILQNLQAYPLDSFKAEPRFLWNGYLLEPLIENKSIHAEVGSEKVNVTLIARRCTRRIGIYELFFVEGTRMWRRGADPEGYAANFVESEQIMQSKEFTASYVQVRGSMPFLWEQIVDLTYKPSFDVVRVEEAPRVLERHFHDLQKKYGAVVAVDLVNTMLVVLDNFIYESPAA